MRPGTQDINIARGGSVPDGPRRGTTPRSRRVAGTDSFSPAGRGDREASRTTHVDIRLSLIGQSKDFNGIFPKVANILHKSPGEDLYTDVNESIAARPMDRHRWPLASRFREQRSIVSTFAASRLLPLPGAARRVAAGSADRPAPGSHPPRNRTTRQARAYLVPPEETPP
jgi:hypothetical protein